MMFHYLSNSDLCNINILSLSMSVLNLCMLLCDYMTHRIMIIFHLMNSIMC